MQISIITYINVVAFVQKFYRTMTEIKPEVEYVIKTGRQVVEKKQVDFPDKLNAQLDAIKQQYNVLGGQVDRVWRDIQIAVVSKGQRNTLITCGTRLMICIAHFQFCTLNCEIKEMLSEIVGTIFD